MEFMDPPKDNRAFISLKNTERSILDAASRMISARIQSGEIQGDVKPDDMKKAVVTAIKMARLTDKLVRAEGEL